MRINKEINRMSEGQSYSTLHPFIYNLGVRCVDRDRKWLLSKHSYIPVDMHKHSEFKIVSLLTVTALKHTTVSWLHSEVTVFVTFLQAMVFGCKHEVEQQYHRYLLLFMDE